MRVRKPEVAYKLAVQEKPQETTWTYYFKNNKNKIAEQGSIKTREQKLLAIKPQERYRFKNFIKNQ